MEQELIHSFVLGLAEEHSAFQTEAHFRVTLGRMIQRIHHDYVVLMECPMDELQPKEKIDMCIEDMKGSTLAVVELKYKTVTSKALRKHTSYSFRDDTPDMARFHFFHDITKLERIVSNRVGVKGYAVFLTNDRRYWLHPSELKHCKENPDDREFHIYEGVRTKRKHSWHGNKEAKGTVPFLMLEGCYVMRWQDYSRLCEGAQKGCILRYLIVEALA